MHKKIPKTIFWCLLIVFTVVCSAIATPERSVGENTASLNRLESAALGSKLDLTPESATLTVLIAPGLTARSMRVARKHRVHLR